jgi:hypothetical protein
MKSLKNFFSKKSAKEKPKNEESLPYNNKRRIRRSCKYGILPPPREEIFALGEK